jgi:hypothetical protein
MFAAPPLAVLLLSNIIFELVAFDIYELVGELKNLVGQGQASTRLFVEARARLLWGTTVFLFYSALIAVTIFSVRIIRKSLAAQRQIQMAGVIALFALIILGHMVYSAKVRNNFSSIFFLTFETLMASNDYTPFQLYSIKTLVFGLNVLAALVPPVVLLADCYILIQKRESNSSELKLLETQMRSLKMLISTASILMAAGVLHMIAWLRWPAMLIHNEQIYSYAVGFSETLGLYWGVTFSLLIAAFYIPAALSINRRAEYIITEKPEYIHGMESQDWLQKHGLSVAPLQQMPQIGVILAPILAGPIGSTLTNLSGSFAAG